MKYQLKISKNKTSIKFIYLILLLASISLSAQVQPFSLISDNMVLQRNVAVPLWGTAVGSNIVTVKFNGQTKQTTVVDGKWTLKLDAMKECSKPLEMHIMGDDNSEVVLRNIVIGEVWLAGGQSNMERQLGPRPPQKPLQNWVAEAAQANYPLIREFSLPHNANRLKPVKSIDANWVVCDTSTVKLFSAVGYYFAKNLHSQQHVPIGIIHSSWGGTTIEKWMSKENLESNPEFKTVVDNYNTAVANYPANLTKYNLIKDSLLTKWTKDTAIAIQSKKSLPKKPSTPSNPILTGDCGGLYTTMIEPLIPYAMKGVIWYQGESNSSNAPLYLKLQPAMMKEWREKWGMGDFPFLYVQLAPYKTNTPELRESQLMVLQKTTNSAMIVTLDCGDTTDVHPTNKKVVGDRLALAARVIAYGEKKLEYSGPLFKSYKISADNVEITFNHTGKGLAINGEKLVGFTISENGKDFVKANALIKGDKVIVSANGITKPIAVRYAFRNNAVGNLCNKDGLPASPFRTDFPQN